VKVSGRSWAWRSLWGGLRWFVGIMVPACLVVRFVLRLPWLVVWFTLIMALTVFVLWFIGDVWWSRYYGYRPYGD